MSGTPRKHMPLTKKDNPQFYQTSGELPVVDRADDIYIWDSTGKRYLDGCSGAITCNLGHNHPAIKQAMLEQLNKISFSYRTQFENEPAIELARELTGLTDGDLDRCFFVGSGSEAVESAIKLARQYFLAIGETGRTRFVSLRPSYHGSTLGALGLTGYAPLDRPFRELMCSSVKVPSPDFYRMQECDEDSHVMQVIKQTREAIDAIGGDKIVAIVLEPVGGASTGARMLNQSYFDSIRRLCDAYGCLLILDEVLSGMGRTGEWFAYQHWNATPDIMALAKGMGAGYYPVGAILATDSIVEPVLSDAGFMHGHTYAGNPLACATGLAVIHTMQAEDTLGNVRRAGSSLRKGLEILQGKFPYLGDVRGIGLLQAIELVHDPVTRAPFPADLNVHELLTGIAKENGLLVYPRRPLDGLEGDHVLITPPLNISANGIDELLSLLEHALLELGRKLG